MTHSIKRIRENRTQGNYRSVFKCLCGERVARYDQDQKTARTKAQRAFNAHLAICRDAYELAQPQWDTVAEDRGER